MYWWSGILKRVNTLYRLSNWKRTGLKPPNLYLIFWTSAVSLFFSDQFYKMSKIYERNPKSQFASVLFPVLCRKWLLCVGQHSLRDWCKTPKCQDTNWDKIHGDLGAFAIASDSIKHGPPSGREKKAESFPEPSKKQAGESGEDPCEGSVFGPLWSVAKMQFFFGVWTTFLGRQDWSRERRMFWFGLNKNISLASKSGCTSGNWKQTTTSTRKKTHHLTPRNMNNLCQSVSPPFKNWRWVLTFGRTLTFQVGWSLMKIQLERSWTLGDLRIQDLRVFASWCFSMVGIRPPLDVIEGENHQSGILIWEKII